MKSCPTCQTSYSSDYTVCPQDGSALRDVGMWVEGSVIRGKYRILSKVGQGGMGTVYKALHLAFDELRALKVIAPEIVHDELFLRRFKQEAVITRKLQHPNAVRVDDIDEAEDGRPFIVMEFIQGRSPKTVIQEEGPMPVPRVCSIVKQVAAALDAAHRLGMVHRDIKPDNIALIESPGGERVKVLDFGIAKMKEARADARSSTTLTGVGMVIGTPQYMSPEQAMGKRGDELDGRSDLYSLGVVMYEMLTGDLPFQAETTMGMLMAHLQEPPRPILALRPELQIPEPIASLTMRLLEKDPGRRPANAKALIEEVEAAEKRIAPPGPTREVQPSEFVSPEIRAASRAPRRVPDRGQAVDVSSLVPTSRPPVQPQFVAPGTPAPAATSPPAVTPTPAWNLESGILNSGARAPAAAMPTLASEKQSHWGIWVGIAILLVGLGAGGWYISYRRSSSVGTAPISTPSERSPTASETPTSSTNVAPTGPAASTVDPKKIKGAITLGDFYFKDGKYADAVKAYQEGLNLDPSNPELLERMERAKKAKAAEERILH